MNWRNFETHREETRAVKQALAAEGINAVVGHGRGTAWSWLEINIGAGQQFGPHAGRDDGPGCTYDCPRCRALRKLSDKALAIAQHVTGRGGEYGGEILVLTQNHWDEKRKEAREINHNLRKLGLEAPAAGK